MSRQRQRMGSILMGVVLLVTVLTLSGCFGEPLQYTLMVNTAGDGEGTVHVDPAGQSFPRGTILVLEALPAANSAFESWEGDVANPEHAVTSVVMDKNQTVTANFGVLLGFTPPEFAGGSGTNADPYLVAAPEHLDHVRHHPNSHFLQIADIDLADFVGPASAGGWKPIPGFRGSYDGGHFKISNLTIHRPGEQETGLFATVMGAELKNICLEDVSIVGGSRVGALVGMQGNTTVRSSYVRGGSVSGADSVGGLVGTAAGRSRLEQCMADVDVTGDYIIGGLVGEVAVFSYVYNSFSLGAVQGFANVGGLAGLLYEAQLFYTYAAGSIQGTEDVGGVLGAWINGWITSSYYDAEAAGSDAWYGARTSAQMKQSETFEEWNFQTIWSIDEGLSYPYLQALPNLW